MQQYLSKYFFFSFPVQKHQGTDPLHEYESDCARPLWARFLSVQKTDYDTANSNWQMPINEVYVTVLQI